MNTLCRSTSPPLRAAEPAGREAFAKIRRRAMLEGCKWDPQVGDVATLSPFPLIIKSSVWQMLAAWAERLSAEMVLAEKEIINQPELLSELGLPDALQETLSGPLPLTPDAGRIMRFDFHLATDGWRISEVNSDVPGGFSEASFFTRLMAEEFPQYRMAGDPANVWASHLAKSSPNGVIALLSAPGYMEDHQVVAFLAKRVREVGCCASLASPRQLLWREGKAYLDTKWHRGPADLIVKFYQAEWLCRLPSALDWRFLFRGGKTPAVNPAVAVISESKRFPLVWDKLAAKLPTWRELLPETRDPRDTPWNWDDNWLLKTAFCNNGDTVTIREFTPRARWMGLRLNSLLQPGQWVAQRRFESLPIQTPDGSAHVCIGVYVVNELTAGAYGRISQRPTINFSAIDVAILVEDDD